jgi:hypothetical protein
VDDYAVDPVLRNDWSALIRCTADRAGIVSAELIPVLIANFRVNLASGAEFDAIAARTQGLSAEFGTRLAGRDRALEVDLSGDTRKGQPLRKGAA